MILMMMTHLNIHLPNLLPYPHQSDDDDDDDGGDDGDYDDDDDDGDDDDEDDDDDDGVDDVEDDDGGGCGDSNDSHPPLENIHLPKPLFLFCPSASLVC